MKNTLLTVLATSFVLLLFAQTDVYHTTALNTIAVLKPGSVVKIPIDPKRWYQVVNATNGLDALFDGDTTKAVNTGFGKLLPSFDAYYPLLAGEQISLEQIRFYDGSGENTESPMTLSIITEQWERIPVARFIGTKYQTWVGPDPGQPTLFTLKKFMTNARYLVLNSYGSYPAEMELYGTYQAGQEPALAPLQPSPFRNKAGINGFEWNIEDSDAPTALRPVDDKRVEAIKSFSSFRHYMDWDKLEAQQGRYTFNPTFSGSWDYDAMYERLKAENIDVLACFQTLPKWMEETYPAGGRDYSNVPARYGADLSAPGSYLEHARVAFQYIARYGYNKHVDPGLLTVSSEKTWAGVNTKKIGLGLIRYIECNNEPDKTWKGRNGYQSPREYAANLSAFYDGHKNTLGAGVGVKNADPFVQVVIGGISASTTDYVRAMIDWCKEFRGYRPDGSVDLCWDVINQHLYANDAQSSQNGGASRGAAPELAGVGEQAAAFVKLARQYARGMPVWITEAGYDINQGSPFRAIPIGNKSVLATQADWILRTALLYSRVGIDRVFFFQAYDGNVADPTQFSSMGLLNDDATKTRKPAADFLYQATNLLGDYRYQETVKPANGPGDLLVDRYELDGQSAYVLVIPDERGRTDTYTLAVSPGDSVLVCVPAAGQREMTRTVNVSQTGTISINVSETPVFVMPLTRSGTEVTDDLSTLQVYPNPAADYVEIVIENGSLNPVLARIVSPAGRQYQQVSFSKTGRVLRTQIDVSLLPAGTYLLDIRQGQTRVVKKITKPR
ncbi:T9SS type A sorting domain-containing protein [Spirosoma luteum]|uniref:T9SS type A sorting domain-containing protein n=1 Tax=Spirosoma luteum TaxID=431553 RepID=UPI00035E5825|nr:T9SS type A sorting domain-containing protein [Spirosoma luteum]